MPLILLYLFLNRILLRLDLFLAGVLVELTRHEVLVRVQVLIQVDNVVEVDFVRSSLHSVRCEHPHLLLAHSFVHLLALLLQRNQSVIPGKFGLSVASRLAFRRLYSFLAKFY